MAVPDYVTSATPGTFWVPKGQGVWRCPACGTAWLLTQRRAIANGHKQVPDADWMYRCCEYRFGFERATS